MHCSQLQTSRPCGRDQERDGQNDAHAVVVRVDLTPTLRTVRKIVYQVGKSALWVNITISGFSIAMRANLKYRLLQ